jgi:clan AA aspartic protease (TIGR02281 family)
MKRLIVASLLLFIPFLTIAQEERIVTYNSVDFAVFRLPVSPQNLASLKILSNSAMQETDEFLREHMRNGNQNFFACNAGTEEANGIPLGLFNSGGIEAQSINLSDGNGNFYLKPNGVFYFTDNDADVVNSTQYVSSPDVRYAIQSGPLLLENGNIHSAFNANSPNRNYRVGVGITEAAGSKEIVFAISVSEVNLYTMASFFRDEMRCGYALCLESGRAFMHFLSENTVRDNDNKIGHMISYSPMSSNSNAAAVVSGGVGNSSSRVVVPMIKDVSGLYYIPVTVNNVLRISFILDSGASDISISPDVANTLWRTGTIEPSDYITTTTYQFADGSTADSDVWNIKEINIGGISIQNVRASISNNLTAPMLLGQSVMQRLGSYTIDNATHCLIIN